MEEKRKSFPGSSPTVYAATTEEKRLSMQQEGNPGESEAAKELWEAIHSKNLTTAWRLLLNGTNPNLRDQANGYSPLHFVCQDGNVALAMLLFTRGADVDALDHSGQTPLHKAAMCGHVQIVTFLVKANAKIELADKQNRSAEELAFQHGHLPIFRLLVAIRGGSSEKRSSLISAVSTSSAKAMKKEQEKRDREIKKLEKLEKKLVEKESDLLEKISALATQKERLQTIPEAEQTKKEKSTLVQINTKLAKLQQKAEKNTDQIRIVRSTSLQNSPTSEQGGSWLDYVN